jgi:hypothetical protein
MYRLRAQGLSRMQLWKLAIPCTPAFTALSLARCAAWRPPPASCERVRALPPLRKTALPPVPALFWCWSRPGAVHTGQLCSRRGNRRLSCVQGPL